MAMVGEFPGLHSLRRATHRAPVNPLDKCTVVSIYPKEIVEVKHTIQPGKFHIDAGSFDQPSMLCVGPSSWWKELDEEQPLLEISNSSIQIADSIVKDYCNGLLACNMGDTMPGLFYIPGDISRDELTKKYTKMLLAAKIKQINWFNALVKLGDVLWARTNANPLAISDDMRLAASQLNLTTKDWLQDFQLVEQVRCSACGTLGNPLYPVCATCKAIKDPKKAAELNIQFAK